MARQNQEQKLSPSPQKLGLQNTSLLNSLKILKVQSKDGTGESIRSLQKSFSQGISSYRRNKRSLNASMISEEKEIQLGKQIAREAKVESRNSHMEKLASSSRKIDDLDQKRKQNHRKQFDDLHKIDQKLAFKKKKFLDDQLQNQLKSYFNESYQKLVFPDIDAEKLRIKQLEEDRKAFERVKKPPIKKQNVVNKAPLLKQERSTKVVKERKHLNMTIPAKISLPRVDMNRTTKNQRNPIQIGLINEPSHQRQNSENNSSRDGSLEKIMNLPLTQQFYKIKSEKKGQLMSRVESMEREQRLKTYLMKGKNKEETEQNFESKNMTNFKTQVMEEQEEVDEELPFDLLIQNIFKESPLYNLVQQKIRQEFQYAQSFNKDLQVEEFQQQIFDKQKENIWTNPFSECPQIGQEIIKKQKEVYQSKVDNMALQKVLEEIFKGSKSNLKQGQDFTKFFVQKYFKGVNFDDVFAKQNRMKQGSLVSARRETQKEVDIRTVFSLEKIEEYKDLISQLLLLSEEDTQGAKTFLTEAGKNYNQFDSIPSKLIGDFVTEPQKLLDEKQEFKCEEKEKVLNDFKSSQQDEERRHKSDHQLILKKQSENKKFISSLVSKIDKASERLRKESQELLRGDENQVSKQQLLYLSFLEIVRQIAVTNKNQSLFMIQIWHKYFDEQETKINEIVQKMSLETDSLQNSMKNIYSKLESFIQKRTESNQKFIQIKSEYEKTLQVLKMSAQLLHIEELQNRQYAKDLLDLHRYTKRVFPRFEGYLTSTDFQIKLMDVPEQFPLDQEFYSKYDEYFNLFEAQVHSDIERVCKVMKMKSKNKVRLERAENNLKIVKGKLRKEEKSHSITMEELRRLKEKFAKESQAANEEIQELKERLAIEIAKSNTARELKEVEDVKKRDAKTVQTQTDIMQVDFMTLQLAKHHIDLNKLLKMRDRAGRRPPQKIMAQQRNSASPSPQKDYNTAPQNHVALSPEENRAMKTQPVKPLEKNSELQDALELELNYQEELAETSYHMREIIIKVRSGQSEITDKTELKSKKKVLALIASFMKSCIQNWERQLKEKDQKSKMGVDFYFFEYLSRQYGLDRLALRHLEANLVSIERFKGTDYRIDLMRKFIGLDFDTLPYSIFEAYIKMIVKSNLNQQNLFQNDISSFFIDYYTARYIYRELLPKGVALASFQVMTAQLKKYTKISCSNSWIQEIANLSDCLCFRDLYDKIILLKSKLTSETFLPLFKDRETISIHELENFILINFKFESLNLKSMLKNVICAANGLTPEYLEKDQITLAFRQKIDFQIPFAAFIHIGINGVVEHQNVENQEFEQLFIFYIDQLGYFDEGSFFQGMDEVPFLAFLQDSGFKMSLNDKKQMYARQCAVNNNEKLSCDDFIDLVRKYNLIPNRRQLEKKKEIRLRKSQKIQEVPEPEQSQDEQEVLNKDLPKTPTPGLILPQKENLKTISMHPSPELPTKLFNQDPKNSSDSLIQLKKIKSVEIKKDKEEVSSVFFQDDKEKFMQGLANSHYGGQSDEYFQDLGKQITIANQKERIKSSKQIVEEARLKLSRLSFPKNIGQHQPSAMQLSRRIKKLDDSQLNSVHTLSREQTLVRNKSSEPSHPLGLGRKESKVVSFQGDV